MMSANGRLRGSVSLTPDITIDITESRTPDKKHGTLEPGYTYRTISHIKNAELETENSAKHMFTIILTIGTIL